MDTNKPYDQSFQRSKLYLTMFPSKLLHSCPYQMLCWGPEGAAIRFEITASDLFFFFLVYIVH